MDHTRVGLERGEMFLIKVASGALGQRESKAALMNLKCTVLLGFWWEVGLHKAICSGPSTDGAEASGGQRPAFKRRFIFHTPARWMCFVLAASQIFLRIFDFCVRLRGESAAGSAWWRGGSGCGLLLMI